MTKLFFIGPISPPFNGPGVKNRIILDAIRESHKWGSVEAFNTMKRRDLLRFALMWIFRIGPKTEVIASVSKNGRWILIPFLTLFNLKKKTKLTLLPAGGKMDEELISLPSILRAGYLWSLKQFQSIVVETQPLQEGLRQLGISSTIQPNPRRTKQTTRPERIREPIRVLFLSSIKESKGVLDAILAVEELNRKGYASTLSIYGRIQKSFRSKFKQSVANSAYSQYLGEAMPDKVHNILVNDADILVLPTFYQGEGLPGILVECVMAELPFVVTNIDGLNYYFENYHSCLVSEAQNPKDLSKKLALYVDNKDLYSKIQKNLKEKKDYFSGSNFIDSI